MGLGIRSMCIKFWVTGLGASGNPCDGLYQRVDETRLDKFCRRRAMNTELLQDCEVAKLNCNKFSVGNFRPSFFWEMSQEFGEFKRKALGGGLHGRFRGVSWFRVQRGRSQMLMLFILQLLSLLLVSFLLSVEFFVEVFR